jgi:hypothetical protein
MQVNKSTIKLFNNKHKSLFMDLDFVDDELMLNGSYPISIFASDIDLYQHVPITRLNDFIKFLTEMIKQSKTDKMLSIDEIKIGSKKLRTYESMLKTVKNVNQVYKYLNDPKPWVKLDLVVFINGYFEDITIIYDFSTTELNPDDVVASIEQDIIKFTKEGKWYKLAKRMSSILSITGKRMPKKLSDLLDDGNLGYLYLTIARLRTLKIGKDRELRNEALSNLREDVNIKLKGKLNIRSPKLQMKNIDKIIKKLENILNSTAMSYIGT